ncbi:hypothetical protein BCR37DRAFT_298217 [Protomyces lactucae-debilis]|uniref:UBA domain-containing protein n=1 Tax=Protomyces lactucae-debilis TaxID=2754530 RepID=A0A1Y2FHV5_PROLT|nr:uncharacterized protein BCR37DRAFT_298217 [Protomyces lactucae-debilis]ORY83187.1 hypothetical protein BCR37DRAFT_298217 [Protomyces lactucae-debilis]
MLTATPSGLRNTPFTKLVLGGILVNSTVASILDVKHLFHIQLVPHILGQSQFWRIAVWQGLYANAGEVLFGAIALYNLRILERLMGTRRFASCFTLCFSLTSILAPLALFLCRATFSSRFNILSSGMTATLFALLFQYHTLVPPSYTIHPTGARQSQWQLSDKVFLFAIAAQLATSQFPGSLVAATTGWLVGACVHSSATLARFRLPSILTRWLEQPARTTTARPNTQTIQEFRPRERTGETTHTQEAAMRPSRVAGSMGEALGAFAGAATGTSGDEGRELRPAAQHDVETLMSMMGISRLEAVQALGLAGNSLERAVENLLQG